MLPEHPKNRLVHFASEYDVKYSETNKMLENSDMIEKVLTLIQNTGPFIKFYLDIKEGGTYSPQIYTE